MERRFWLDPASLAAGSPDLMEEDRRHALRVLRMRPGDLLEGIDGAGGVWRLEIASADRDSLALRVIEQVDPPPAPGSTPSAPHLSVWLSPARGARLEPCVERLTQLGASRIGFLECARTPPAGPGGARRRLAKLERVAREALMQCGRLWTPEVTENRPLEAVLEDLDRPEPPVTLVLDAHVGPGLGSWARSSGWGSPAGPTRLELLVGPEGGWTAEEARLLREAGALPVRLADHILRIETAAEAACAVLAEAALP